MHQSVFPSCQESFATISNIYNLQAVSRKKAASTIMAYTDCTVRAVLQHTHRRWRRLAHQSHLFSLPSKFRIKPNQTFLGCVLSVQYNTNNTPKNYDLWSTFNWRGLTLRLFMIPSKLLWHLVVLMFPGRALNSPSNCFSPVLPRMVTEPSNFPSWQQTNESWKKPPQGVSWFSWFRFRLPSSKHFGSIVP